MAKKRLPETPEEVQELASRFFDTLKAESDRGCVLVAAAFLDEGLELLLRSKMRAEPQVVKGSIQPLFTGIGPLKSFWAKIELARAFNFLVDWEYEDLTLIREIRNLFAHSYEDADFDDLRIIEMTRKLRTFGSADFSVKDAKAANRDKEARLKFTLAAAFVAGRIHDRAGMARP